MPTEPQQPFRILLLLPETEVGAMTLFCARIIARSRRGKIEILYHQADSGKPKVRLGGRSNESRVPAADFQQLVTIAETKINDPASPVSMLVTGWSEDIDKLQEILNLTIRFNLPGLVVNWTDNSPVRRILFSSSGGLHTVPQVWIVSELAKALHAPIQLLRVVQADQHEQAATRNGDEDLKLTQLLLHMLGMRIPVATEIASDVVTGVEAAVTPDDLIIVGGPNYGRTLNHFHNSIPDILIRDSHYPSLMLIAEKPKAYSLQNVFWDETIRLDLQPRNREELIAQLIDNLVKQRQLPGEWCQYVLDKALEREQVCPTSVGCETAFPHVTIPGFSGITGCFGICPRGIDFGEPGHPLVRFVFLLITPSECYQDYLITLAHLARQMIKPEVRKALLRCRTPGEAQLVLIDTDHLNP